MVESIANSAISTMLRAQNFGTQDTSAALKNNKQATQAIISQFQDGVKDSASESRNMVASSSQIASATPTSSLPRGSLVDMIV